MDAPRNITKNKEEKHWFRNGYFNRYSHNLRKKNSKETKHHDENKALSQLEIS